MHTMIIQTKNGKIRGVDHGDYLEFRKVPYAQPPIGALRFRRPQPPLPYEGVYDATKYAPRCMQTDGTGEPWDKDFYSDASYNRETSEDCLYLNLWVPRDSFEIDEKSGEGVLSSACQTPCPIAMWIHGGAFLHGNATEMEFDGAAYAKNGVILASVEYRCGVFGFFAHPWLTQEDEEQLSGNYGIYDQIAALDWLMANAAEFGGDGNRITVFGQSAGAMSVQTLISSPLTRGKIRGAILQSGGSYGIGLHHDLTMEQEETFGLDYTEILGVQSLEELRSLPAQKLLDAQDAFMAKTAPKAGGLFLVPVVDGKLLTDHYYKIMDAGLVHPIPYMIGCTKDDIDIQKQKESDPWPDHKTMLYEGSVNFSLKLEETGMEPAYVYYFTRNLPGDQWGAYHSSELFYVFDTLNRCWRPWEEQDYMLRDQMIRYWTNFVKYGNPNGAEANEAETNRDWKPCSRKLGFVKELN